MKNFLEWRHNFMVNNPNILGVIAFLKGVVFIGRPLGPKFELFQ